MLKLFASAFRLRRRAKLSPHQVGAQTRKANALARSRAHRLALLASMEAR